MAAEAPWKQGKWIIAESAFTRSYAKGRYEKDSLLSGFVQRFVWLKNQKMSTRQLHVRQKVRIRMFSVTCEDFERHVRLVHRRVLVLPPYA